MHGNQQHGYTVCKFTPLGKIGGKVYNNWQLNSDAVNKAATRWHL